jgi:hypothetical protein
VGRVAERKAIKKKYYYTGMIPLTNKRERVGD